jgi:hypothetical protein
MELSRKRELNESAKSTIEGQANGADAMTYEPVAVNLPHLNEAVALQV